MILRNVIGMGFRVGFGLGFGLTVVFSASAHDEPLPPLCKNPRAERVTIGTFSFSEAELAAYAERRRRERPGYCPLPAAAGRREASADAQETSPDGMPQGRCGIVNAYHDASEYMYVYCKRIGGPQEQSSFRVSSPNSYNAPQHHEIYRFSDAPLTGICYVCRIPKPPRPPREERKDDR